MNWHRYRDGLFDSGMPQGSTLGPTLFAAFIDPLLRDFTVKFPQFRLQAFVDDTGLFAPVKSLVDASRHLQPAIDFISPWIVSAGLDFNLSKSQAIIFRYGHVRFSTLPHLHVRNQNLEFIDEVKTFGRCL